MADKSFDKSSRLLSAKDFSYLKSNSTRIKNKYLLAYHKTSQIIDNDQTRLGLAVSKKVGNAVIRNRTKRVMRDLFRNSDSRFLGKDVLIIVSPFLYKNFPDMREATRVLDKSFKDILLRIKPN